MENGYEKLGQETLTHSPQGNIECYKHAGKLLFKSNQ